MSDLDPELRELLSVARQGLSPSEEDTRRVKAHVTSELSNLARMPRPSPWQGPALLAIGLAVGGFFGFTLGQRSEALPRPGQTSLPSPRRIEDTLQEQRVRQLAFEAPAAAPKATEPTREPAAPRRAVAAARSRALSDAGRPHASASDPVPPAEPALIADEVELMKRVQRALGRDEPAWALALLQQLDEQVPGGRLLEERAAGRAIANCSIDPTSGQEELRRFSSGYPRSVHLSRVTQVCTPGGGKSDPR